MLSESEYESDVVQTAVKAKPPQKKSTKFSRSDSEEECESIRSTAVKRKAAKPSKKDSSKPTHKAKKLKEDIFGLNDEVEIPSTSKAKDSELKCSLSNKIGTGVLHRTAALSGEYYIELRVYVAEEAIRARPEERYKKALLTAKVRLDPDSEQWRSMQKFVHDIKLLYNEPKLIK